MLFVHNSTSFGILSKSVHLDVARYAFYAPFANLHKTSTTIT